MVTYPVTWLDGSKDTRYAVNLEWCGHEQKRHVLRFCGEFVGSYLSLPAATLRAVGHKNPNPPIIEQKA